MSAVAQPAASRPAGATRALPPWWPLAVGWQGPFSGQNTINVVMDKAGLLEKRGLESKFQVFASGPDVNEAIAAARIQVGNEGDQPLPYETHITLVDFDENGVATETPA